MARKQANTKGLQEQSPVYASSVLVGTVSLVMPRDFKVRALNGLEVLIPAICRSSSAQERVDMYMTEEEFRLRVVEQHPGGQYAGS